MGKMGKRLYCHRRKEEETKKEEDGDGLQDTKC
jgi:hypothetical protein